MRFSTIGLLALPLLATAAPNPWQVTVSVEEEQPLQLKQLKQATPATAPAMEPVVKMGNRVVRPLSEPVLKFDDSRIADHPDKVLLARVREFFRTFTTGDFVGMRDLQSEDYDMTDIPIAAIRATRSEWFDINRHFVSLMEDLRVIGLTLYGSSEPGSFSILEHVVWFKLISDPPPPSIPHLPVGAKPGDTVGMINLSVLFWDEDGLISREFEYGRLTWKDFNVTQFDRIDDEYIKEIQQGKFRGLEL